MSRKLALYCTTLSLRRNIQSNFVSLQTLRKYSTEKVQQEEADSQASANKSAESEIEKLTQDIKVLTEKNDTLMDKYKRALADSENMRTRLTKQINDAKVFGIQSFCKDLLEVADTLGHATAAVPQDQISSNPHLKSLYEGLCLTQASLLNIFKRHGLEPINPLNEKFNPNLHEALFTKADANVQPDTVVEVTKLGYKLHDRCIRPALVGVAKSP